MSRKKKQAPGQDKAGDVSGSRRRGKKRASGLSLLGISWEGVDTALVKRRLLTLAFITILMKVVVIFTTTSIFNIFYAGLRSNYYDNFDFQYYLQSILNILHGQMPYVNFAFSYPPLAFIPISLAFIPAYIFNSFDTFVISFQILMVICDIIIVVCVYLIGLKLYNEKTAFRAALLYATAFAAAYFILTKYDAFPTCILMLAVLFAVCNKKIQGYLAILVGFLAKIFPVIALPFVALYNARTTSIRQEITSILKIWIPVIAVIFIPVLLLDPGIISSYVSANFVRSDIYVNTAIYTIYAYLHGILNLGISVSTVSDVMYILMGLLLLTLLAIACIEPEKDTRFLVKLLAVSIFVVVFCMNYNSPQYIVWFTPFVCLLVADSLYGIIIFYATQVITYIEFPLAFGPLYINGSYAGSIGTSWWYLTLGFFTLNAVAYLLLIYWAVKPSGRHLKMLMERISARYVKRA
jgi:hypothetical protein